MSRAAPLFALLLLAAAAPAADLPPGAIARFGDDRFRTGGGIYPLILSPDGTQFATVRSGSPGALVVAVWDAATGRPVRSQEVTGELFKGMVWGPDGGFVIVRRVDPGTKGQPGQFFPNDFRVWAFTDPKAAAPPVLPVSGEDDFGLRVRANHPAGGPLYPDFILSADGRRVAARGSSGEGKRAIHVFELKPAATASQLTRAGTIDLGAEGADTVLLSADGKTVVTFRKLAAPDPRGTSDEYVATVWDVATGEPAKPVRVIGRGRFILTPEGRSLVVGAENENEWGFNVVDLATGKSRTLIRWPIPPAASGEDGFVDEVAFFPSGRVLAVSTNRKVILIDIAAGKELGRLEGHSAAVGAIAVSTDGTRIATGDRFGLVRLWEARSLRPLHDARGHRAPVEHAELSPDGKRLLTWAEDETVRLWDIATGAELRAFTGAVGIRKKGHSNREQPTFTPDGTTLLYSSKTRLIARDIQTGLEVPLPGGLVKLKPALVVFAPDGKAVLTCEGGTRELTVWDWPGGRKRFAIEVAGPKSPGFSADGSVVYPDATLPARWDAKTGQELAPAWRCEPGAGMTPLDTLRPNPRHLIDARGDTRRIIEAGSGKPVADLTSSAEWPGSGSRTSLSPDHRCYTDSGGTEWEVRVHETATGQPRRKLGGHAGRTRVLGFTPDGSKLLTAGGDHTVLIWDMRLQSVPLPEALRNETDAAKLWDALATGTAKDAYLAMARFAREPDAAVKMVRWKLKPAAKFSGETDAMKLAAARAIELLEALDTDDARALLKELAGGRADAFCTQEAKRARERHPR